ncbi:MAG TPA: helix-turn-helix transcriptional regulator [Candidatus Obscuribacterales bacterium]
MATSSSKDKKRTNKHTPIEEGSGNVYVDLGFSEGEAVNLLVRSELTQKIQEIIKENRWTQEEAAKLLGVSQPRISDLMNRRIEKFTVDMLMKWLCKLGKEVTVFVKDKDVA